MIGSTLYHCPECRHSWPQSACFATSVCLECGGTALEAFPASNWELVDGRVVERSPRPRIEVPFTHVSSIQYEKKEG